MNIRIAAIWNRVHVIHDITFDQMTHFCDCILKHRPRYNPCCLSTLFVVTRIGISWNTPRVYNTKVIGNGELMSVRRYYHEGFLTLMQLTTHKDGDHAWDIAPFLGQRSRELCHSHPRPPTARLNFCIPCNPVEWYMCSRIRSMHVSHFEWIQFSEQESVTIVCIYDGMYRSGLFKMTR